MKFDKNNVFTTANASQVKEATTGYFADSLAGLQRAVEQEDVFSFNTVTKIQDEHHTYRFSCQRNGSKGDFALFYPVEEPKEKKFRPYATEEEIMEAINLKGGAVWIKSKYSDVKYLITGICTGVIINNERINTTDLLDSYTYLDGSPCGIEE